MWCETRARASPPPRASPSPPSSPYAAAPRFAPPAACLSPCSATALVTAPTQSLKGRSALPPSLLCRPVAGLREWLSLWRLEQLDLYSRKVALRR